MLKQGDADVLARAAAWEASEGVPWAWPDVQAMPSQLVGLVVGGWVVPVGREGRRATYRLTARGRQAAAGARG